MLDKIQFKKLENGYTVSYHVAVAPNMAGKGPSGFGNAIYVQDKEQLKACVSMLVDKYLNYEAPQPRNNPMEG